MIHLISGSPESLTTRVSEWIKNLFPSAYSTSPDLRQCGQIWITLPWVLVPIGSLVKSRFLGMAFPLASFR